MNPIKQFTHAGYTIKIYPDTDAQSPNDWGDDGVFIVADHRQFCIRREGFDVRDMGEHLEKYDLVPLYAYIHSGVSLNISGPTDRWDSGQVGWVVVSKAEGVKDFRETAQGLVDTWNQYLDGDVYGYVVEDGDGEHMDSCWGFYGLEDCEEQARASAEHRRGIEEREARKSASIMHV